MSLTPEFLRPPAASEYLRIRWGIRATVGTLAKYRHHGSGGPRFRVANRDILYAVAALDDFARERISTDDFMSTVEACAASHAPA